MWGPPSKKTNIMKKLFLLMSLIISGTMALQAKTVLTPAQQLIQRMAKIQQKGYMYGHQDDPFYGITWSYEEGRSDTKDLVGDYPGVMGFDLGGIERADLNNLDDVPFETIRQEIIKQHERGGIVTLSWHPRNPLLGTTAWIESDLKAYDEATADLRKLNQFELAKKVVDPRGTCRSVLPGGSQYEKFQLWLHRVAEFLKTLKDSKGNPIPFIFRPWHENNGSWFWWGQKLCTDEEYLQLWNMTQDYVNNVLPTNIVWSYSPNLQGNWTEEEWLKRYPGDDRIDLIGEDAYQWGTEQDFINGLNADLQIITKIGKDHGKLIAVTECGYKNSPDATWWTRVFKQIIDKYPVCYFLPWRNAPQEHFGCSKDATTADDFKQWYADKRFLFVNDIKKIK